MPPTAIDISARCLDRLNEGCRKMGRPGFGLVHRYHLIITIWGDTKWYQAGRQRLN